MTDVHQVAALNAGPSAGQIPLSDWAVSQILACCCPMESASGWPNSLAQDPSLAGWLAARMPGDASLRTIVACIDSIAQESPIDVFSSSITAAPMSGEAWQAFRHWWRQEAAAVHLAQEALADCDNRIRPLIPILCQLIGLPLVPEVAYAASRPMELVTSCDKDVEIVRAIEQAKSRLREDRQLADRCLTAEQRTRVDCLLNPLHGLLPGLLRDLADLQVLRERFDERLEQEKLLSMKELAYGASHEINNPLANISSRAQVLLREESNPQRRRSLATINSQAFRAHEMIADMMLFAKPPALDLKNLDPKRFLDSVVEEVARELPSSIDLLRDDSESVPVTLRADPIQLTVAIQAICANAVEAMEGQGQLAIRLRQVASDWGQSVAEIEIQDDGPGIPPEVRKHLFDPFYSGREAGRGLGFGLSKAWRIIQLHGGQICVDSQAGDGATFTLCLPMSESVVTDGASG